MEKSLLYRLILHLCNAIANKILINYLLKYFRDEKTHF